VIVFWNPGAGANLAKETSREGRCFRPDAAKTRAAYLDIGSKEIILGEAMMIARGGVLGFGLALQCVGAIAANCGHDVQYGAARFEQTKLGDSNAVLQYFSPSFIVMENVNDPRHRVTGECRAQGIVTPEGPNWVGGCIWKNSAGDTASVFFGSKPGDVGTEKRAEVSHGTFRFVSGTGRMAVLKNRTGKWSGLETGGAYFCDD